MSRGQRIGPVLSVEITGMERLQYAIRRLSLHDMDALLEVIGSTVESQTRTRISTEKTDPDGGKWKPWSSSYAATRHSGHSLLVNDGNLRDSIEFQVEGNSVVIGSNLVYAGYQNATRTFLGLSDENQDELQHTINDWMRREMGLSI